MNVFPGSTCPMRDLSCVTSDGSNVITTTTTSDDAECGGELTMYLSLDVTIGNDGLGIMMGGMNSFHHSNHHFIKRLDNLI